MSLNILRHAESEYNRVKNSIRKLYPVTSLEYEENMKKHRFTLQNKYVDCGLSEHGKE